MSLSFARFSTRIHIAILAKPHTPIIGCVVESSATPTIPSATSAPASGTATPLGKRQRSATDVKDSSLLDDSFNYLVSKLSKFTHTYDEVNIPMGNDIRTMVEEDNTNAEAIMMHMLATIVGSLHSFS